MLPHLAVAREGPVSWRTPFLFCCMQALISFSQYSRVDSLPALVPDSCSRVFLSCLISPSERIRDIYDPQIRKSAPAPWKWSMPPFWREHLLHHFPVIPRVLACIVGLLCCFFPSCAELKPPLGSVMKIFIVLFSKVEQRLESSLQLSCLVVRILRLDWNKYFAIGKFDCATTIWLNYHKGILVEIIFCTICVSNSLVPKLISFSQQHFIVTSSFKAIS